MHRPLINLRGSCWLVLALAALACSGCRGCRSDDPAAEARRRAEEEKKKEEEEKGEFEIEPAVILPGGENEAIPFVKPGHWATVAQQMTFHKYDFIGSSTTRIVDRRGRDIPVARTPFTIQSTRPVVFSKGQPRIVEILLYVPVTESPLQMISELRQRRGVRVDQSPGIVGRLAPYQSLLVVLAEESERYGFLKHVNAVDVPYDGLTEFDDTENTVHYRVVQPDVTKRITLPDNPLAWTTIAYVLWDEIDPARLTPEQQTAMVDWLHWGGQLIINGPDSLDLLKGSFLAPYLPALSVGSRRFTADDLAELSFGWMVRSPKAPSKPLAPERPWTGVALDIHPDAHPLPSTGQLFVERDVARGRIVVSAMQLSERELINWNPHFQSLLNACLLRRPPRKYRTGITGRETLLWADGPSGEKRLEARRICGLRYFARDTGVDTNFRPVEMVYDGFTGTRNSGDRGPQARTASGFVGGVAAWNDFSTAATEATKSLRDSAEVEVPQRSFVVICVAAYLVVLVPLNWLFFRSIGRVEWAWIAAPIIAVLDTLVVVHQAQLDIGFVRAQTEIGILELQPEYARGHLTRFTALYTSLSTTYDLEFENLTTLAAPLGDESFQLPRGTGRSRVVFQRHDMVRLNGVQVSSNSTNMVRSEQMLALDGPIQLGTSTRGLQQIENRSQHSLHNVAIVRRVAGRDEEDETPRMEGVWIGDLASRDSRPVSFRPLEFSEDNVLFAMERQRDLGDTALDVDPLVELALNPEGMAPGEVRLVALIDDPLPGEVVQPAASQVRATNVVVAHLAHAPRPAPQPDLNAPQDVVEDWKSSWEF